ncbi:MAG: HDOD domain-containing protein [Zoogloeaceae bacterium]|nr:HDOD domain-containing protein [Zoogloeaceae bacterium]
MTTNPQDDKKDAALKAQRFKMLEDIARELSGDDISFPTCFDAALQIRNALRKPEVSLRQIAQSVNMEPLVATKLLRVANSVSHNPGGQKMVDVEAAVGRVGVETARSVAFAVAMDQLLRSKDMVIFGDFSRALWQHTIRTAAAARVIAKHFTRLNRDEAMIAGLVHDLGAFYMLYRAAQYEELRIRPDTVRYLIAQWHESIGETLMNALGLPEHIVDSTHDHDQAREEPVLAPHTLSDVVYVANLLAGGVGEWANIADDAEPKAELQHPAYQALAEEIEAEFQELLGALS